ncbi:hypothetical protein [Ferroplasma sp.]|uniref:hypothetical protein n=1 Tax=Ferroplasma sp. TaxID=2591003 RepID=UPI00262A5809|nr:hypothetical protein [Ferroplasma sp.]
MKHINNILLTIEFTLSGIKLHAVRTDYDIRKLKAENEKLKNMFADKRFGNALFSRFLKKSVESTSDIPERVISPKIIYSNVKCSLIPEKGADYFTRFYSVLESYRTKSRLNIY